MSELQTYLEANDKTIEETKATSATLASQLDTTKKAMRKENYFHVKERGIYIEKLKIMKERVNNAMDEGFKSFISTFKKVVN